MDLPNFFPATQNEFQPRAGDVACVTEADLLDEHRRRHLDSFSQSMGAWRDYEHRLAEDMAEPKLIQLVRDLSHVDIQCSASLEVELKKLRKKYKISPSKSQLAHALKMCVDANEIAPGSGLVNLLIKRQVRSSSGVAVITVLTSPGKFSCPKDCHYCPNEPGQPRSYLSTEPAVLRANQCGWDAARQFWDRARTLTRNGHVVDKIEVLVLGGTWSGYSHEYQEEFVRDLFYAANEFPAFLSRSVEVTQDHHPPRKDDGAAAAAGCTDFPPLCPIPSDLRSRLSLEEEQIINESSQCKVIGLTLETRPDYISKYEIGRLRKYGCTRVQIGIQHTNEAILKYINRGCTTKDASKAIRMLKDAGYKVDIHLMPDLPGSNLVKDRRMFDEILQRPDLQADQWKIYPCEVTPFSQIEQWYREGVFRPYAVPGEQGERDLLSLILQVKRMVYPWIRLNRVVRDIPNQSIIAGNNKTNLRQILEVASRRMGWTCKCIRCREIRLAIKSADEGVLTIRAYNTLGGTEYFLSFETVDKSQLFGFLRLRLPDSTESSFEILKGKTALVRELHVYGMLVATSQKKECSDSRYQHSGFGKRLLLAAEVLAISKGYNRVAIIAGVGTRNYYRKFDYELVDTYMAKDLKTDALQKDVFLRWHLKSNELPSVMIIDHYDLELMPSVEIVPVPQDIVSQVLEPTSQSSSKAQRSHDRKQELKTAEYHRTQEHNRTLNEAIARAMWVERLTIPFADVSISEKEALLESVWRCRLFSPWAAGGVAIAVAAIGSLWAVKRLSQKRSS